MHKSIQPRLIEVPSGWQIVRTGKAEVGDKYWRASDRVWLPLVQSDEMHGADVGGEDMPVVIRKRR